MKEAQGCICPACSGNQNRDQENLKGYRMMECSSCGLFFADPMKAGDIDFYKQHFSYQDFDEKRIREHRKTLNNRWNRELMRMLEKGSRTLDIGCGFGTFVDYCRGSGMDSYGVDFNNKLISAGKEHLELDGRLFVDDIAKTDLAELKEGFDLITLFEVIEHVTSPESLISMAREKLKPGGLLAVSCPNEDRWQPVGRVFLDYPPHHLTRWRPKTLKVFLDSMGFDYVTTKFTSSFRDILGTWGMNRHNRRILGGDEASKEKSTEICSGNKRKPSLAFQIYKAALVCSIPFDIFLKMAGVGTMGMRMIVRKRG